MDCDETDLELDIGSDSSKSPSSKPLKLPWHLQAQLVEDIEAFGGIALLDIGKCKKLSSDILDKRPDLYKLTGHPIRKSICKLVNRWIEKSRKGIYNDYIRTRYSVTPYCLRESSVNEPPQTPKSSTQSVHTVSPSPSRVQTKSFLKVR
jgi:hypothetical protein